MTNTLTSLKRKYCCEKVHLALQIYARNRLGWHFCTRKTQAQSDVSEPGRSPMGYFRSTAFMHFLTYKLKPLCNRSSLYYSSRPTAELGEIQTLHPQQSTVSTHTSGASPPPPPPPPSSLRNFSLHNCNLVELITHSLAACWGCCWHDSGGGDERGLRRLIVPL